MKSMLRLNDFTKDEILQIYKIADDVENGLYANYLQGKTIVMFFPTTSLRTRVTFEKGIHMLGGQSILFPSETLDKKEAIQDVVQYLQNWVDLIIVRHKDIHLLEEMQKYTNVSIINAMTDSNHPCEVISDLYALSKIRSDYLDAHYLFCGGKGNIGYAWKEISDVMGLSLTQCCSKGYEIDGLEVTYDLYQAAQGKDILCTDSYPEEMLTQSKDYQVTTSVLKQANPNAVLNPCPPFYRGEEVSDEVIQSPAFVGYTFKKHLLTVQQAIMIYCLQFKPKEN